MPSFDLSRAEMVILAITVVLVILPSRLAWIGNLVGRLLAPKR
jgi:hypothetical protein